MSRFEVWARREGEWVGAVARIIHAAQLERTDYEYYTLTACGLRGDRWDLHRFFSLTRDEEITCLRCLAHIASTPGARITAE